MNPFPSFLFLTPVASFAAWIKVSERSRIRGVSVGCIIIIKGNEMVQYINDTPQDIVDYGCDGDMVKTDVWVRLIYSLYSLHSKVNSCKG